MEQMGNNVTIMVALLVISFHNGKIFYGNLPDRGIIT